MTILFSEHSPERPRRPRGRVPSAREGRGGEGIYAEDREEITVSEVFRGGIIIRPYK